MKFIEAVDPEERNLRLAKLVKIGRRAGKASKMAMDAAKAKAGVHPIDHVYGAKKLRDKADKLIGKKNRIDRINRAYSPTRGDRPAYQTKGIKHVLKLDRQRRANKYRADKEAARKARINSAAPQVRKGKNMRADPEERKLRLKKVANLAAQHDKIAAAQYKAGKLRVQGGLASNTGKGEAGWPARLHHTALGDIHKLQALRAKAIVQKHSGGRSNTVAKRRADMYRGAVMAGREQMKAGETPRIATSVAEILSRSSMAKADKPDMYHRIKSITRQSIADTKRRAKHKDEAVDHESRAIRVNAVRKFANKHRTAMKLADKHLVTHGDRLDAIKRSGHERKWKHASAVAGAYAPQNDPAFNDMADPKHHRLMKALAKHKGKARRHSELRGVVKRD